MEIRTTCRKCKEVHKIELRKSGSITGLVIVYQCNICGTLGSVGEIK